MVLEQQPGSAFTEIDSGPQLEELFELSEREAVLLFKHSNACPVSGAAYSELRELASKVAIVTVQTAREISSLVEFRTGIRHETPQVIVLRRGDAVWNASHWNVTADIVRQALADNS